MMKALFEKLTDLILSPLSLDFDSLGDMHGGLFTEINNYIYLGRRPDESSVTELKQAGITHIVSCLDKEDQPSVDFLKKDFSHLFFGVRDGIHASIETTFPQFFEFTEGMMRLHSKPKLFVHCEVGVSRSATLVIAEIIVIATTGDFTGLYNLPFADTLLQYTTITLDAIQAAYQEETQELFEELESVLSEYDERIEEIETAQEQLGLQNEELLGA